VVLLEQNLKRSELFSAREKMCNSQSFLEGHLVFLFLPTMVT